jgi:hypothetical protein
LPSKPRMPKQLGPIPEPWERQPEETDEAWEAFQIYRDMKDKRVLERVAERLGKTGQLISRWKIKHRWHERCLALDIKIDREFNESLIREKVKARTEVYELGRTLRLKAAEKLNDMIANGEMIDKKDILPWAELGSRLERLALGEATESIKIENKNTDDEIERLLDDPDLARLALQLDRELYQRKVKSARSDDEGEPEMGESEPS